jgi:carbonyl reductase 1
MERVAIVTGANKGIGYHIAKQLVESGHFAHVVLGCRDAERGQKAAEEVGGEFMQVDIGDLTSITAFSRAFQEKYNGLDCLVNNAALAFKGSDPTPFAGQTGLTLRVNFEGTVALTQSLLPLLRASTDSPRLVTVASMAGHLNQLSPNLQAQFSSPSLTMDGLRSLVAKFMQDVATGTHRQEGWGNSNYGFSKLAVIAASTIWARENPGILVNACCPGYCDTDMTSHRGTRSPADGARNATSLVELPDDGPSGGFYKDMREAVW